MEFSDLINGFAERFRVADLDASAEAKKEAASDFSRGGFMPV